MENGNQWMKRAQDRAKSDFARHEVKEVGPGHWRLKRPDSGQFWCDIVVMSNVGLAVWGDIEGCFFAYCSGATNPRQVVAWMANADVSYYGRQKAHIGMGGAELVDSYELEVALHDLDQALEARRLEHDEEDWEEPRSDGPSPKMVYEDAFEDARSAIRRDENIPSILGELCHVLMRDGVDDAPYEWVYSIGRVTSTRVIYALAAVARLHELLQDQ